MADIVDCRAREPEPMPKNRWIYVGILFVAAAALIWAGTELGKRIEAAVPYAGLLGAVLIIVGLVIESKKKKEQAPEIPETPKA